MEEEKKCVICDDWLLSSVEVCLTCKEGLEKFNNNVEYLQAAIYYLNPMEKIR